MSVLRPSYTNTQSNPSCVCACVCVCVCARARMLESVWVFVRVCTHLQIDLCEEKDHRENVKRR